MLKDRAEKALFFYHDFLFIHSPFLLPFFIRREEKRGKELQNSWSNTYNAFLLDHAEKIEIKMLILIKMLKAWWRVVRKTNKYFNIFWKLIVWNVETNLNAFFAFCSRFVDVFHYYPSLFLLSSYTCLKIQ